MRITGATTEQIVKAVKKANKLFGGNLDLKLATSTGINKEIHKVSLRVKDRDGLGVKQARGKRTLNACWHAHGFFFEALLKINKSTVVEIFDGRKVSKQGGNWEINERRPQDPKSCACDDDKLKKGILAIAPIPKIETGIDITEGIDDLDKVLGL